MKQLFAAILVILVLLGSFKEASIYLSFKLNQKFIAENLCVEKDVEDSTCKGCCQLKKKVEETRAEDNAQVPERQREQTPPIVFFIQVIQSLTAGHISTLYAHKLHNINNYSFLFNSDVFHPPKYVMYS